MSQNYDKLTVLTEPGSLGCGVIDALAGKYIKDLRQNFVWDGSPRIAKSGN